MTDYRIAVVEDAIAVLEELLHATGPLSLAELTNRTEFSKNKVFRILATLEAHRLVLRDGDGRYTLGLRFMEFSEHVRTRDHLIQATNPEMDRLSDETQETIFLSVIDAHDALVIAARQSPRPVRLSGAVGRRGPLHTGGTPKTLLAFLPDDERAAMLDRLSLERITPYTITDRDKLESRLAEIREAGYVVTADDVDLGAISIAAPIYDFTRRVVAAMSIAGPVTRFPEDVIETYTHLILEATRRVSQALGYRPPVRRRVVRQDRARPPVGA